MRRNAGIATIAAMLLMLSFSYSSRRSSAILPASAVDQARLKAGYLKLPLSFVANQGQSDKEVKFLARGIGYSLFLTSDEAVLSLKPGNTKSSGSNVLRLKAIGANHSPEIAGVNELLGKSNYYVGKDPSKWRDNVPSYAKVQYKGVYPGIDLVYYGNQQQLEHDWIVSPGADPKQIRFNADGVKKMEIDDAGNLVLSLAEGEVVLHKPVAYQEEAGKRHEIQASFQIAEAKSAGFQIGDYDANKPLVIDPVLVYSTYLGGSSSDYGNGIAVDSSGCAHVVGVTGSSNFPRRNACQITYGGGNDDAFISKFYADGSSFYYSTFLGGSIYDNGLAIALDGQGNAYLTGYTGSTNFPTLNASQPSGGGTYNGCDAFVAKIAATGTLLWSTYLGGSNDDKGYAIAVDASGNAYVAGTTSSSNFPTLNPLRSYTGSYSDAFVSKYTSAGVLNYSTFLGGYYEDIAYGIAVDPTGIYITGSTASSNFPITSGAFQTTFGGYSGSYTDAFLTKLNPAGSALIYSTYLGGSNPDNANGIAVDSSGNAYVTGKTSSTNFPIKNGFQPSNQGSYNVFVTKFNPTASALIYSSYLGGNYDDSGRSIVLDSSGNAFIGGSTYSANFPIRNNPLKSVYNLSYSGENGFLAKIGRGGVLVYSTLIGGSQDDSVFSLDLDSSEMVHITGYTSSSDFATTPDAYMPNNMGQEDAFYVKLRDASPVLEVQLNQAVFISGDIVSALEFRLRNLNPAAEVAELGVYLRFPGIPPISLLNMGYDGSFVIPSGFNSNLGPFSLFTVNSNFPRGKCELTSRMVDPVTKALVSEHESPFVIQ